jgi:hypothetical protein
LPFSALRAPQGPWPGYFHLPLAGLIEKISAFMRKDTQKVKQV